MEIQSTLVVVHDEAIQPQTGVTESYSLKPIAVNTFKNEKKY